MCSLHCLVKELRPVQHILPSTTPPGVFSVPCLFLALHGKEHQTCATHSYKPSGVFLMPCVFLAPPAKETAEPCNTFLQVQHPLVCFYCNDVCVPCIAWKRSSRPVQHILTTTTGVFLMPCVFLAQKYSIPVQHILTTPSGVF